MTYRFCHRVLAHLCLIALCAGSASAERRTLVQTCPSPPGCRRVDLEPGSFGAWLRTLPLKDDTTILAYDGSVVRNAFYDTWAVVDLPLLFSSDLEQCADYGMRLWAEYHRETDALDELYLFDYGGKKTPFRSSGRSFRSFLKHAFAYSNSYSLKQGCATVPDDSIRPGDLIVQNERGGIGHVSVILDMCIDSVGTRLLLIGYSFMPAQEFHVERAGARYGRHGWFTLSSYRRYLFENLNLGQPVLRRLVKAKR